MQVICISKAAMSGGLKLAQRLAKKLGCACVSREELIVAAAEAGIWVSKLETAMIKPRLFSERLAMEREHYRAFSTAYLCDRAAEGRLVYHGRTGHLLLSNIDHVLKVRIVSDEEQRIRTVVKELKVDRARASKFIKDVDEDTRRWARSMYGIHWEDVAQYDLVINLGHMSVGNAATALVTIAELPDFQMTPASEKAMEDLRMAAKSRLCLARDARTYWGGFKVRADEGVVTVTFLPQDSRYVEFVSEVLAPVAGIRELRTTMATTNILWVQERFDPKSDTFREIAELATKWNAAVELLKLASTNGEESVTPDDAVPSPDPPGAREYNGGIEDDVDESPSDDGGMKSTLEELAVLGRSGGGSLVRGGAEDLLKSLPPSLSYSLVVIGDVYRDKGHATKVRMTRELERFVGDHVAAPVVGADDLKAQYLFGRRDVARLAGFLAFVAALYFLVFSNQQIILKFLSGQLLGESLPAKCVVAAAVFIFVPFIALCYGSVAKSLMKLIKME